MIHETTKHKIRWMCQECTEIFDDFDEIEEHIYLLHDEFVKVKPEYYIEAKICCKKCSYYTILADSKTEFIEHWKEYHSEN